MLQSIYTRAELGKDRKLGIRTQASHANAGRERERERQRDRRCRSLFGIRSDTSWWIRNGLNVCVCGDDDSAVVLAFAFAAFLISFKIEITKDRIYKHPVTRGADIAQWIRLLILSCCPGFEFQAHMYAFVICGQIWAIIVIWKERK